MSDKPILCLDFDGVIHSYTSGWKGADVIPDPPVPGAIHFIKAAINYFDIAIFSSRSHQEGGIEAMKLWLMHNIAVEYGEFPTRIPWVELIQWPVVKPSAHITIDDRALLFTGDWPSIDDLLNFKPWNKREP